MKPLEILARQATPTGGEIVLYARDGVYHLRVDGLELMSSRAHGSEHEVARLACTPIADRPAPRVLIGGLGFGYTLRAALDCLPAAATVVVCELFSMLLEWNRKRLGELARHPLRDRRVRPLVTDVWDQLAGDSTYDAIILDVDNGPWAFTIATNSRLYSRSGLERLGRCLEPGGVLAVWSAEPSRDFARRLVAAGFVVETRQVAARGGRKGPRHTIFVARRQARV